MTYSLKDKTTRASPVKLVTTQVRLVQLAPDPGDVKLVKAAVKEKHATIVSDVDPMSIMPGDVV